MRVDHHQPRQDKAKHDAHRHTYSERLIVVARANGEAFLAGLDVSNDGCDQVDHCNKGAD